MEEMGVLNSWVMLFMKSFFSSVSFFWRNTNTSVTMKVMSRMMVKMREGIMNHVDRQMYLLRSGK